MSPTPACTVVPPSALTMCTVVVVVVVATVVDAVAAGAALRASARATAGRVNSRMIFINTPGLQWGSALGASRLPGRTRPGQCLPPPPPRSSAERTPLALPRSP